MNGNNDGKTFAFLNNPHKTDNAPRKLSILPTPEYSSAHKTSYYDPFPKEKRKWDQKLSQKKDPKSQEDLESLEKSLNEVVEANVDQNHHVSFESIHSITELPPCSLRVMPYLFEEDRRKKAVDYQRDDSVPFPKNYYKIQDKSVNESKIYIPEIPLDPYPENVEFYLYNGVVLVTTPDRSIESRTKEPIYGSTKYDSRKLPPPRTKFKRIAFENFF